jgi:hypothetical protein
MSDARAPADDPLGCRAAVERALAQPELAPFSAGGAAEDAAGLQAAYRVAVALGECRLFGVSLPDDLGGVMPTSLGLAAARQLQSYLDQWVEQARALEQRWAERDPVAGEDLCLEVVETRMEAWAAFVAVDEAYADCLGERDPLAGRFAGQLDAVLDRLEAWDGLLQQHVVLLSVAADTQLLGNWRANLAGNFRQPLPWWLDGCLEEAARQLPHLPFGRRRRWLPAVVPTRVLAAETSPAAEEAASGLKWLSPDGRFRAYLTIPGRVTDTTILVVAVLTADDRPATELAGQPMTVAGFSAQLTESGRANLPAAQLEAHAAEEPRLTVGGVDWPLQEEI